jgi:antitoxin component YwqK of YwqJK toxin-antitoxin module
VQTFRGGTLEGPYRTWFASGQKREEGEYRQGKREGTWRAWNEDGTPDETLSGEFKNDRRVNKKQ